MKCKNCKDIFELKFFNQKFCMKKDECITAFRIDNKTKIEKAKKNNISERKEKLKTYSQKLNSVKLIFQKWIRNRDIKEPCISCGKHSDMYDGGHYKKAEIYSGVLFNENNVHKQCRKCNRFLNGNELNYRTGLINKIGLEEVEKLEKLADETRYYKYSEEELTQIKEKHSK